MELWPQFTTVLETSSAQADGGSGHLCAWSCTVEFSQRPCSSAWWHLTAHRDPGLSMQPQRAQQGPRALWLPLYFGVMITEPAGLSLTAVTPAMAISGAHSMLGAFLSAGCFSTDVSWHYWGTINLLRGLGT